jgi:hypothetical protein
LEAEPRILGVIGSHAMSTALAWPVVVPLEARVIAVVHLSQK